MTRNTRGKQTKKSSIVLSIDAMGGDLGPPAVVAGIARSTINNPNLFFILHGPEDILRRLVNRRRRLKNCVKIVNDPTSIRNISEKLFSINFKKLMPPTIFTKNLDEIKKFIKINKKIVLKPIHGYAGKDIIYINSIKQIKKIRQYLKKIGHVMAQKYLPGIKYGDKRVFIINGKVKGAISRVPSSNSILSNLSQGGKAVKTTLSHKEINVSNQVAKVLKKNGIFFAGIDLVSGYLIGDINVTSPTGLPQFKELTGVNLAKNYWDELEKLK